MAPDPADNDGGDARGERPGAPADDEIAAVPNGEEAWRLIDGAIDGPLPAEDRRRLEQLVVAQPAIARLCLRTVHLWYGLQLHMRRVQTPEALLGQLPAAVGEDADEGGGAGMHETMILPAMPAGPDELVADADDEIFRPPTAAPPPASASGRHRHAWRRAAIAAAAAVAVSALATWSLWPGRTRVVADAGGTATVPAVAPVEPAPATVTAIAGAVVDGSATLAPHTVLARGQMVRVSSGAIELTFDSGAVVVVSAPSQVVVVDRNTLALATGSVAAHVPAPAVGFTVVAAGLSVVDRGTNFGVRTADADAAAELDVFDGVVDATAIGPGAASTPVRVTAGHAVRHDSGVAGQGIVGAAYEPGAFTRDVARVRVPLRLHGTGVGVTPGADDPLWQIVSVPNDPAFKPRPASVTWGFSTNYAQNPPDGRWVSTAPGMPDAPGGDFVFRTTVDLTGYDPATVEITAHAGADDNVSAVRINDVDVGLSTPTRRAFYPLALPARAWRAGLNQLDVVVHNGAAATAPPAPQPRRTRINPMALSWVWDGSASPIVRR
jgi:hypothetical protein